MYTLICWRCRLKTTNIMFISSYFIARCPFAPERSHCAPTGASDVSDCRMTAGWGRCWRDRASHWERGYSPVVVGICSCVFPCFVIYDYGKSYSYSVIYFPCLWLWLYSYSVIYLIEIWLESTADNTINTLINQVVCRSCSHKTMNDLDGQN